MALRKLPCEYPALGIARAKRLMEGWTDEQKTNFINALEKCSNNLEKIKYEKYKNLSNTHAIEKHELQGGTK